LIPKLGARGQLLAQRKIRFKRGIKKTRLPSPRPSKRGVCHRKTHTSKKKTREPPKGGPKMRRSNERKNRRSLRVGGKTRLTMDRGERKNVETTTVGVLGSQQIRKE